MNSFFKKVIRLLNYLYRPLINVFKNEESRFRFMTGIKMAIVPLFTAFILGLFLMIFLEINLIFFNVNGFDKVSDLNEAYYDYILSVLVDIVPYFAVFTIFCIFMGVYISDLLLRPFKIIGDYCSRSMTDKNVSYDPDFYNDLKLLTAMSEYFFNIVENHRGNRAMFPITIPARFTRIHKPVFEHSFYLQYSLFFLITSICIVTALNAITVDIHSYIIQLSIKTLNQSTVVKQFLTEVYGILGGIKWGVLLFSIAVYLWLANHLYAKVAGPAFAVFATMRSFLTGNFNSRVRLIGYGYLRGECRKLNKYLDKLQKDIENSNE